MGWGRHPQLLRGSYLRRLRVDTGRVACRLPQPSALEPSRFRNTPTRARATRPPRGGVRVGPGAGSAGDHLHAASGPAPAWSPGRPAGPQAIEVRVRQGPAPGDFPLETRRRRRGAGRPPAGWWWVWGLRQMSGLAVVLAGVRQGSGPDVGARDRGGVGKASASVQPPVGAALARDQVPRGAPPGLLGGPPGGHALRLRAKRGRHMEPCGSEKWAALAGRPGDTAGHTSERSRASGAVKR